jgi:hypothetical protein
MQKKKEKKEIHVESHILMVPLVYGHTTLNTPDLV